MTISPRCFFTIYLTTSLASNSPQCISFQNCVPVSLSATLCNRAYLLCLLPMFQSLYPCLCASYETVFCMCPCLSFYHCNCVCRYVSVRVYVSATVTSSATTYSCSSTVAHFNEMLYIANIFRTHHFEVSPYTLISKVNLSNSLVTWMHHISPIHIPNHPLAPASLSVSSSFVYHPIIKRDNYLSSLRLHYVWLP